VRSVAGGVGVVLAAAALLLGLVVGYLGFVWASTAGLLVGAGLLLFALVVGAIALPALRRSP
jgi:hypothetical protein